MKYIRGWVEGSISTNAGLLRVIERHKVLVENGLRSFAESW
jgi:hypothetical protein